MAGRGTRGSTRRARDSPRPLRRGWDSGMPERVLSPELRWILQVLPTLPDAPIEVRTAVQRVVRRLPWVPDFVARAVGVKRRKPRGRPPGRRSLDSEEALSAIAIAIDAYGFRPVDVLRHLGRITTEGSSTADFHWLQRRLERGRCIVLLPRETRSSNDRAKRQRSLESRRHFSPPCSAHHAPSSWVLQPGGKSEPVPGVFSSVTCLPRVVHPVQARTARCVLSTKTGREVPRWSSSFLRPDEAARVLASAVAVSISFSLTA